MVHHPASTRSRILGHWNYRPGLVKQADVFVHFCRRWQSRRKLLSTSVGVGEAGANFYPLLSALAKQAQTSVHFCRRWRNRHELLSTSVGVGEAGANFCPLLSALAKQARTSAYFYWRWQPNIADHVRVPSTQPFMLPSECCSATFSNFFTDAGGIKTTKNPGRQRDSSPLAGVKGQTNARPLFSLATPPSHSQRPPPTSPPLPSTPPSWL